MYQKLIYILVLIPLVHTITPVFNKQIMFAKTPETYNVLENQQVILMCKPKWYYNVIIIEIPHDSDIENIIVVNSVLNTQFSDRFIFYSDLLDDSIQFSLMIKNVNRDYTGNTYKCMSSSYREIFEVSLAVYYPPKNNPTCRTNFYDKQYNPTILECTIEDTSFPTPRIHIANKANKGPSTYTRNKTHITQQLVVNNVDDISEFGCFVYVLYPQGIEIEDLDKYNHYCHFIHAPSLEKTQPTINTLPNQTILVATMAILLVIISIFYILSLLLYK